MIEIVWYPIPVCTVYRYRHVRGLRLRLGLSTLEAAQTRQMPHLQADCSWWLTTTISKEYVRPSGT